MIFQASESFVVTCQYYLSGLSARITAFPEEGKIGKILEVLLRVRIGAEMESTPKYYNLCFDLPQVLWQPICDRVDPAINAHIAKGGKLLRNSTWRQLVRHPLDGPSTRVALCELTVPERCRLLMAVITALDRDQITCTKEQFRSWSSAFRYALSALELEEEKMDDVESGTCI